MAKPISFEELDFIIVASMEDGRGNRRRAHWSLRAMGHRVASRRIIKSLHDPTKHCSTVAIFWFMIEPNKEGT
jgi:hypothetical protein